MDEKKYQVFVSSTYEDLIDARKKIIETVLSLYHLPVGMEMFSADDSEQWEIIKETIDASDYYVIIIGHRYGSISPSSGVSYTEMEYDYAKSIGVPVLAFIRERDVSTSPKEREFDSSKTELLNKFIDKAKSNKLCSFWSSMDDLATKIAVALPKIMMRNPRTGWVRGDKVASSGVSKELAELSTENRRLREKLREYESNLLTEMPVLTLLGLNKDLSFKLDTDYDKASYIRKVSVEDFPSELRPYITREEINDYNAAIPPDERIDAYNKRLFLYENYINNSVELIPRLINNGRKVATDIYVEIEIPDFIKVISSSHTSYFSAKPMLNTPIPPIKLAQERFNAYKDNDHLKRGLYTHPYIRTDYDLGGRNSVYNNTNAQLQNLESWIEYNKNRITLRAKKLIQSLAINFEKIIFIPLKEGSGLINFKLVCEELKEPILFSHKVTVTSKDIRT